MEVSVQLQSPAGLTSVSAGWEVGLAAETIWTWKKEKYLASAENQTLAFNP
jgi:hypothetical protein